MKMKKSKMLLALCLLAGSSLVSAQESERLRAVEEELRQLKERVYIMDLAEEIKQVTEYICPAGHLYDNPQKDNLCPKDALPLKERKTYRKFTFSRRESISEKIEAALEEKLKRQIVVGAFATGVAQELFAPARQRDFFGAGSTDLVFAAAPMLRSTLFVNLEAGGGVGPDERLTSIGGFNEDGAQLASAAGGNNVVLREVWFGSRLFRERLSLVIGKIDMGNYFDRNAMANDETSQFLSGALVNNPVLAFPPNRLGAVVFYQPGRFISFGAGIQDAVGMGSRALAKAYGIAEMGFHNILRQQGENLRFWGRIDGNTDEAALGLSLDEMLSASFGIFGRAGARASKFSFTLGENYAFSAGWQWQTGWPRARNRWAFAYARNGSVESGSENIIESYYSFFLTDHLRLSPHLQVLLDREDPAGDGRARSAFLLGLRTHFAF